MHIFGRAEHPPMNKKTIFLTIGRAMTARNLLLNDFGRLLSEKYQVVIFTPAFKDREFNEKFSKFIIEPLYQRKRNSFARELEKFFVGIHKALIYNSTVELRTKYGLNCRSDVKFKKIRHTMQKYVLGKFFQYDFIRDFFKKLDSIFFRCDLYNDVIDKYNPSLVFITNIGDDDEVDFLRNCKAKGIKSVGSPKSWDETSKLGFREKTDRFVVWSDYMKEEALKFQSYREKEIAIAGVPQFDYYKNLNLPTREEFCKKYGLDPSKKIIFYGSEGMANEHDHIALFLREKIKDGTLKNHQILIQPHFSYKADIDRFLDSVDDEIVFIDKFYRPSNFKDHTELSLDNVKNLMCEIKYSDAVITGTSTLILDAIANGKFVIIYNFDDREDLPYKDSVKRYLDALWFREILKIDLDNVVNSRDELIEKIKKVETEPSYKQAEREKLIERFCYKIDGQSGQRLFNIIDKEAIII